MEDALKQVKLQAGEWVRSLQEVSMKEVMKSWTEIKVMESVMRWLNWEILLLWLICCEGRILGSVYSNSFISSLSRELWYTSLSKRLYGEAIWGRESHGLYIEHLSLKCLLCIQVERLSRKLDSPYQFWPTIASLATALCLPPGRHPINIC